MASPSATRERLKFHVPDDPTSLDRCDWCGEARQAHGPDWECRTRTSARTRVPAITLVTGAVMVLAGFLLMLTTPRVTVHYNPTRAQDLVNGIGTALLLVGLLVAISAAVFIQRTSAARHPAE